MFADVLQIKSKSCLFIWTSTVYFTRADVATCAKQLLQLLSIEGSEPLKAGPVLELFS